MGLRLLTIVTTLCDDQPFSIWDNLGKTLNRIWQRMEEESLQQTEKQYSCEGMNN